MRLTPAPFADAAHAIEALGGALYHLGREVPSPRWQGVDAPDDMWELLEPAFRCPIAVDAEGWAQLVQPHLPWAEEHFQERIGGRPTNPGRAWERWPFFRDTEPERRFRKQGQFTHTYQERIWPKRAARGRNEPNQRGIHFELGDLRDLVALLRREPLTRQAYLPIWFPEDTGALHGGRVPCTLGYLFMYRHGYLHCSYYIRSCDFFRHLRDDIYLAGRLAMWVLEHIRSAPCFGADTLPTPRLGYLNMYMGSLHCWSRERNLLPR